MSPAILRRKQNKNTSLFFKGLWKFKKRRFSITLLIKDLKNIPVLLILLFLPVHGNSQEIIGPGRMPNIIRDSQGNLHIFDGFKNFIIHYKGDENGNFGSMIQIPTLLLSGKEVSYLNVEMDQNGNFHIAFSNGYQMAADEMYYTNNISGSWKMPIRIYTNGDHSYPMRTMVIDKDLNVFIPYNRDDDESGVIKIVNVVSKPSVAKTLTWSNKIRNPEINLNENGNLDVVTIEGAWNRQALGLRTLDKNLNEIGAKIDIVSRPQASGVEYSQAYSGARGPDGELHFVATWQISGGSKLVYSSTGRIGQSPVVAPFDLPYYRERGIYSLVWDQDTLFVVWVDGSNAKPVMAKLVNGAFGPIQELSQTSAYNFSHYTPKVVGSGNGGFNFVFQANSQVHFLSYNNAPLATLWPGINLNKEHYKIFPNPFTHEIKIEKVSVHKHPWVSLEVFNIQGKLLYSSGASNFSSFPISLSPGKYLVTLKTKGGRVLQTQKMTRLK